jgi:hypothetical protein
MIKQLALLGVVALVSGCASHENRVAVDYSSSPQAGMYAGSEYDNPSKGAGARSMMENPYSETPLNVYGMYYGYYTAAAGAAMSTGETSATSKGAGSY